MQDYPRDSALPDEKNKSNPANWKSHRVYWNDTALNFYGAGDGLAGVHQSGRFEQVVLVNNYGNLSGYADGILQFSTSYDASVSSDNLMHFFLDDSGENSSGQLGAVAVPELAEYAAVAGLAVLALGIWRRSRR